ncbi:MAG: hypothetical protein Ta2C_05050 [Candidatus Endomicrobiellum trichonymphae]|nr:MAG: hypothetical protein Ta2C_05050 [Candidatus Endomicrobium trichonymphae]
MIKRFFVLAVLVVLSGCGSKSIGNVSGEIL